MPFNFDNKFNVILHIHDFFLFISLIFILRIDLLINFFLNKKHKFE